MKLTIYNGSPRRKNSNTDKLLSYFIKGFCSLDGNSATVHYIADKKDRDRQMEDFANDELIVIIMPLYCHAMPGTVKEFIEALPDESGNSNRKIGFIIQSGFEESYQSSFLKAFFDTFPKYFNCSYLGTVIKGGVEALSAQPAFMSKKVYKNFEKLGKGLASNSVFDKKVIAWLAKPYKYSKLQLFIYKILFSKFANEYWNVQLKENGCLEQCYNKPYVN